MANRKRYKSGEYKIESGIPLNQKRKEIVRFPFDKMKIGDSFYVPKKEQPIGSSRLSIYTAVKSFNSFNGKKVKISTRGDDNGLRGWRIK